MAIENEKGSRTNIDADIPALLRGALAASLVVGRRTGKTARVLKLAMLELGKSGKRTVTYICPTVEIGKYCRQLWGALWREQGLDPALAYERVVFACVEPKSYKLVEAFQSLIKLPSAIYFDHTWLEQYHDHMLMEAHNDLVGAVQAFAMRYETLESARETYAPAVSLSFPDTPKGPLA
jgi:hypothetical protein